MQYLSHKVSRAGFTLIEIMVVITIIGILTAVLSASFNQARQSSKNKAVRASLSEAQLALELYKAQNGEYPIAATVCDSGATVISASSVGCVADYITGLTPEYTPTLPSHTKSANSSCSIVYSVASDQSYYKLTAVNCYAGATNAASGIQQDDEFARCPSTCSSTCAGSTFNTTYKNSAAFYESMAIYSVGGECI